MGGPALADDGGFLLDLRLFQFLGLLDFLLLHLPAAVEDKALLLAQHLGFFIGHLLFLPGGGEAFGLVQVQHLQAGFQGPLANRQAGLFGGGMAGIAGGFFLGHHGGDAGNLGLLAFALLLRQHDLALFLGLLAGQGAVDLGQFVLFGLFHQFDLTVPFGLFQCQIAADIGQFFFPRLGDQVDLPVPAFLFQGQIFLNLGGLPALGLFRHGQITIRAHALEVFFVVDFLFLDAHALIQHIDLFLAQLFGLLVGDFLVLIGPGHGLVTLDLQQLQLGIQILLADRHGGAFFRIMHLALGIRCDLGDHFQAFGVKDIVGAEKFLTRLFQGNNGDFFQYQAVGGEALGHAIADFG